MPASSLVPNLRRLRGSHSRVAKKLPHIALSRASPAYPIEGLTPASLHRRPNATDVYCAPWSLW